MLKKNNIDLSEYEDRKYNSYNDFFTRKVKSSKRKICQNKNSFISPCDGNLTVYKINEESIFNIKNSWYKLSDLLEDNDLAKEYSDGYCLIFRLEVKNYHRYCYIDNGIILSKRKIKGILHTVQAIAVENHQVYTRNTREYMILDTSNFNKIIQIEVGALMVGKINNYHTASYRFHKGEEKGLFEFGGSTIILLVKKDVINIDKHILENSNNKVETMVKLGEEIANKL